MAFRILRWEEGKKYPTRICGEYSSRKVALQQLRLLQRGVSVEITYLLEDSEDSESEFDG